jgi:YD repeat-containing protein
MPDKPFSHFPGHVAAYRLCPEIIRCLFVFSAQFVCREGFAFDSFPATHYNYYNGFIVANKYPSADAACQADYIAVMAAHPGEVITPNSIVGEGSSSGQCICNISGNGYNPTTPYVCASWAATPYCPPNASLYGDPNHNYQDYCACNVGATSTIAAGEQCVAVTPIKNSGLPPCGQGQGNPIGCGSGNKYEEQEDYKASTSSSLRFTRYYNSLNGGRNSTGLPAGWTHFYDRSIGFNSTINAARAVASRPDGRALVFSLSSGGSWVPDGDVADTLVQLNDASGNLIGWRYRSSVDNTLEAYDAQGNLLSITSYDGRSSALTYSTATSSGSGVSRVGQLLQVTDQFGRSINFAYSGMIIQSVSDNAGNVFGYSVDSNGNLATVLFPDAKSRAYEYNESANTGGANLPSALTGITDENGGRFATFQYNATGLGILTEHAGSVVAYALSYTNDTNGNITSTGVTDPLGANRTYLFSSIYGVNRVGSVTQPSGAGSAAAASANSYDGYGNVLRRIDFDGNQTCYAYDTSRNIETARLEGTSSSSNCPLILSTYVPTTGTAQRLFQTQWHPTWRLKSVEAAPLKLTHWIYNGQPDPTNGGAVLSCAPGTALLPDGNPIAVLCKKVEQATTDATGAAGFGAAATGSPRVWTYTYNQYGQVLTSTGPRGNLATSDPNYAAATTTYQYYAATDTANTPAHYQMGDRQQVTDAAGHTTTYPQYDGNGRVLQQVDPNGTTTSFTYFPRGWLQTRTVTPPGSSTSQLTSYAYDGVGQLKRVTQPDSSQINYTYDAAHRLTQITDSASDSINYSLDAMGNRTQEQVKDPAGNLARQVSRVYDALNRLQTVTGALQ